MSELDNTSNMMEQGWQEGNEMLDEVGECSTTEGATALHGAEDPRTFRLERSEEYIEPMSRVREVDPFQDPSATVEHINPLYDPECGDDPYTVNCADCARCFEATWRGLEQEAAGRAVQLDEQGGLEVAGEASEQTEEWAHEEFELVRAPELRSALEAGGHGSSAIVHSTWEGTMPGGHAYNVVNFEGQIITVDSQEGKVFEYSDREIYADLETMPRVSHRAIVWDSKGRRIL